jgi:hypothetical protein
VRHPRRRRESPAAQLATSDNASFCRARHIHIRRRPEQTVLHQVVREHLETFLAETRLRGAGEGLPRFVERERREFLTCGVMARGFARLRCSGCKREILVAFSCKGHGFSVLPYPGCERHLPSFLRRASRRTDALASGPVGDQQYLTSPSQT